MTLRARDAALTIHTVGATPLSWRMPLAGTSFDVLDGYRDPVELDAQDGVRNGVMAPFCNRIADGRYRWNGAEHDLLPGSSDRTIYHGLVRTEPFDIVALDQADDAATAHLRCTALASGTAPGYPFPVVVDVVYVLAPHSLEVEIVGENRGTEVVPFASGWHPYFRLPGAPVIDALELRVPSSVAVQVDDALLPLEADAAFRRTGPAHWTPIADAVVDAAFTGLDTSGGVPRTTLDDPGTGVRLTIEQERGLVHVFTGDTLARDRRASVAVEPVEAMTDAFNRSDCTAAVSLGPGERRSFRFRVRIDR